MGSWTRSDKVHQAALFKWLRAWGCRQFAKKYETAVTASLVHWSAQWLARLPAPSVHLTDLSGPDISTCVAAYEALRGCDASRRRALRDGRMSRVTYGATGAAKTLFALRPRVFPPWDDPIRTRRHSQSAASGFEAYLVDTAEQLRRLAVEAGVAVSELPRLVGRPASSPPKLIDEYYWVTLTRAYPPPDAAEIAQWARWASGGEARDGPAR
jgi:hypothetical protein